MIPLLLALTLAPEGYVRKPDFKAKSEVIGEQIFFHYGDWSWQDDYSRLNNLGVQYGIMVQDPANPRYYESDLSAGLFRKHPLVGAIPDYSKLIALYQGTVAEIYRNWSQAAASQNLNRRESIELLLRFFQDYPYGIPPKVIGRRYIGGLLVPPLSLEAGWADCDSKSLLMATILSYDPYFKDKLAMILVPGHALLGIEIQTQTYDETYEYQNRTFVVAEPTGLSRTPFGRRNSPYNRLLAIIPLESPEAPTLTSVPTPSGLQPLAGTDCPDEGLLVEYYSDLDKGKVQVCMIKEGAEFIKHGPLLKYDSSGKPKSRETYSRGKKI